METITMMSTIISSVGNCYFRPAYFLTYDAADRIYISTAVPPHYTVTH